MIETNELIKIGESQITIKEYKGKRVVTFKDIDQCHDRPEGTAKRNFNENRKHLVKNIDFFELQKAQKDEIRTLDIPNRGITVITESGYLMLVKSFTDDLAWDVQRQLVNSYFRKGPTDKSLELQIKQERAHAMLINAQVRKYKMLMQTLSGLDLSEIAKQTFGLTAIEEATEQKINYRPECGNLYSAGEIAEEIGTTANMIGRKANAAGLKTDEYGIKALSKSEHSEKQVPTFMYNEKGRAKVKELFSEVKNN